MHSEVFATRAVHLVHEVEHLDIELDMQQFADVREGVEETAVFSLKIDRHYVFKMWNSRLAQCGQVYFI